MRALTSARSIVTLFAAAVTTAALLLIVVSLAVHAAPRAPRRTPSPARTWMP
jgi:hypothetical protein